MTPYLQSTAQPARSGGSVQTTNKFRRGLAVQSDSSVITPFPRPPHSSWDQGARKPASLYHRARDIGSTWTGGGDDENNRGSPSTLLSFSFPFFYCGPDGRVYMRST